jgi:hypothetical protein
VFDFFSRLERFHSLFLLKKFIQIKMSSNTEMLKDVPATELSRRGLCWVVPKKSIRKKMKRICYHCNGACNICSLNEDLSKPFLNLVSFQKHSAIHSTCPKFDPSDVGRRAYDKESLNYLANQVGMI